MTLPIEYDALIVGAGVVGPAIATALARQDRKVLIIERDWSKSERIVGELLQPKGFRALGELGMAQAVNNIDAIPVTGYYIKYNNSSITIEYPEKSIVQKTSPFVPVNEAVFDTNDSISDDDTLNKADWDNDERVRGVSFRNGEFLSNLRKIVKNEPNVSSIEATVVDIIYAANDPDRVIGVNVKQEKKHKEYYAKLVICCDGIYSKFRKQISPSNVPHTGSYFVGLRLIDCELPEKFHGHVILGSHAPILLYQTSKTDTRILCAYRSDKPPSQSNNELFSYLEQEVYPALPEESKPSFRRALETKKFKAMPNQYLSARKQGKSPKGFILLGDALNMRHPLTGGGMTVGLCDAALLAKLLSPENITELDDYSKLSKLMAMFHSQRKPLDAVINTLSIALYTLFAADKKSLVILQKGCFEYFLKGGDCVDGPVALLSGTLPSPYTLFYHFFSVAFFAIYINFKERGFLGFPIALYEAFDTLITAIVVFTPYLWKELVC